MPSPASNSRGIRALAVAEPRVVVTSAVIIQPRDGIEFPACEFVAVANGRVRLGREIPKTVVFYMVDDSARGIGDVADGAQVIGQVPGCSLAGPVTGNEFVELCPVQIGGQQPALVVEVGPHPIAVVNEVCPGGRLRPGAVGIDPLGDPPVKRVVGVRHLPQDDPAGLCSTA